MKSVAYRTLNAAAAKRADVKAKAARDEALQLEGKQLLSEEVTDVEAQYCCAMPQESDASLREALFSYDEYGETSEYNGQHIAVAAAMVAGAPIKTAPKHSWGPSCVS